LMVSFISLPSSFGASGVGEIGAFPPQEAKKNTKERTAFFIALFSLKEKMDATIFQRFGGNKGEGIVDEFA
jgi:hypothetical protein